MKKILLAIALISSLVQAADDNLNQPESLAVLCLDALRRQAPDILAHYDYDTESINELLTEDLRPEAIQLINSCLLSDSAREHTTTVAQALLILALFSRPLQAEEIQQANNIFASFDNNDAQTYIASIQNAQLDREHWRHHAALFGKGCCGCCEPCPNLAVTWDDADRYFRYRKRRLKKKCRCTIL